LCADSQIGVAFATRDSLPKFQRQEVGSIFVDHFGRKRFVNGTPGKFGTDLGQQLPPFSIICDDTTVLR
jgi:hypothetical protein